jgi:hypothetical protein
MVSGVSATILRNSFAIPALSHSTRRGHGRGAASHPKAPAMRANVSKGRPEPIAAPKYCEGLVRTTPPRWKYDLVTARTAQQVRQQEILLIVEQVAPGVWIVPRQKMSCKPQMVPGCNAGSTSAKKTVTSLWGVDDKFVFDRKEDK